ncbi:MAG: TolC family protein [Thermoanaerobaculales bacterium]|jgi:outer membrane protein TolC|nr:TolC family protein [Thermoanaerobaculales bacterium]
MDISPTIALLCALTGAPLLSSGAEPGIAGSPPAAPADAIVARIPDSGLRSLLLEVLERNPEIAALQARVAASGERGVAARRLPDPSAELTAFVLPPETRVGPQRLAARVTQRLPGGGKLKKSGLVEAAEGRALAAELEALRLDLVARTRRLVVELSYLDEARRVLTDDHATLSHFELLTRARYAAGAGLQLDTVKLQAEMTRLEARRAAIDERWAGLASDLNRLRDRPGAPVPSIAVDPAPPGDLPWEALRDLALANRPELAADDARIEQATVRTELAAEHGTPDFSVGLTYAYVEPRTDADVPDNGQDVLGLSGGITIPLWRAGIDAEVEAATQTRIARQAQRRATSASVVREVEEVLGRLPEIVRRLHLLAEVLPVQAEQALASAEAAYAAGRVEALSLLDTERVLLDVRLSAARARADLAIALIDLEDAIAAPLPQGEPS